MERNYDEWMQASIYADAVMEEVKKELSGTVYITMDELMNVKFDVVSNFGFQRRRNEFFIMNTTEPRSYGEDARNYIWYTVKMNDQEDMKKLADCILKMFGVPVDTTNSMTATRTINGLYKKLSKDAKVKDWGACHVTHLPINQDFLKEGVIYE